MSEMTTSHARRKNTATEPRKAWPLFVIAAPAAVAIWTGWVGLGGMCGFGIVRPLPGIADGFTINTAITLPVGIEAYAAYALAVWLRGRGSGRTQDWARKSAIGALVLGALGQVAFHLMTAAGWARAPWFVVVGVSCLPVVTIGCAATLHHLLSADQVQAEETESAEVAALEAALAAAREETALARAEQAAAAMSADAELRGALDSAQLAVSEAERREAEAAANAATLTRKLAAAEAKLARKTPPKKTPTGARGDTATEVPQDVDAQAQALAILADEPEISGARLAERVGKSERWGQTFKKNLAARGELAKEG